VVRGKNIRVGYQISMLELTGQWSLASSGTSVGKISLVSANGTGDGIGIGIGGGCCTAIIVAADRDKSFRY
jgi:hypothetical protein